MPKTKTALSPLLKLQRRIYRQQKSSLAPHDGLFETFTHCENLRAAWDRVRSNPGADTPGIDGQTASTVVPHLDAWLTRLQEELRDEVWQPDALKRVDIPKSRSASGVRQLGILTIADRVVHTALKQVLEPLIDPAFSGLSYGFRPGRSVAAALTSVSDKLSRAARSGAPFGFAVHLDISNCFDELDHTHLGQSLRRYVSDRQLLNLLDRVLCATATSRGPFWNRRSRGIAQGSSLSPLLCNLYLSPLDTRLEQLHDDSGSRLCGYRYADDLLLIGRNRRDLRRGFRAIRSSIRSLRLRFRDPGAATVDFRQGVPWLGVRLRKLDHDWSPVPDYGFEIPAEKVRSMLESIRDLTRLPQGIPAKERVHIRAWINALNTRLRQWAEVYQFASNSRAVFRALDEEARHRIAGLLRQSLRNGENLNREHRCQLSRGFWTWQASGVQLINLSCRPPRHESRCVRRPDWTRGKSTRRSGTPSSPQAS